MSRLFRILRSLFIIAIVLSIVAFAAHRIWRGPDPETILAGIEVPSSPPLTPEDERATFRLAPGFRVELVASEPMVVDPVAMDWDDAGRLFVVEMRGFMGDVNGAGEDQPVGRVVVLEDTDHDGRMDQRHVFLDGLVLPRAIAVLPEGVLVGVPPDLLLCRDENADLRCDENERHRVTRYADEAGNVEHRENGLLSALDGWIYNAKSSRRFRLRGDAFEVQDSVFRGQWGIAQDDDGRLYSNHNSGFLYVDPFPSDYTLRQSATAARILKAGVNIDLAADEKLWGVRVAPGLNRAYQPGTLRADGRQNGPTGVSGLVLQRGDQFGEDFRGDAFVPESAGNALAHFRLEYDGLDVRATHLLYPDAEWEQREFLASTDERFRPVDVKVGPDGALWMIDMYRGVIQHADYVSDYLREYIETNDLEPPGARGRIWRIVAEDRPIEYAPPRLVSLDELVRALDHPNGWVRDRAMRQLIFRGDDSVTAALSNLDGFSANGRIHALWTLRETGALDLATWQRAIGDEDPRVRQTGIRVGEILVPEHDSAFQSAVIALLTDPDPTVRLQAIHSLGVIDPAQRPLAVLLSVAQHGGPIERQAVLSSLSGLESRALGKTLATPSTAAGEWLQSLTTAAFMAAGERNAREEVVSLLDAAHENHDNDVGALLLGGIDDAQNLPGHERIVLGEPHPLFAQDAEGQVQDSVQRIRRGFTWKGDPNPGGARALTAAEEARRLEGERLFLATCANCHGTDARGLAGLAPPLVASTWVRDADEWLLRIILQGVTGPIAVGDARWNSTMPGHGLDSRFDDPGIAGLATFLRRSWSHADEPIDPVAVARIRRATEDHPGPWTEPELLALPISHRLDRFTGVYRVPVVGIEMVVRRSGAQLTIGRREGGQAPLLEIADGLFSGEGMRLSFDATIVGAPPSAELTFGDQTVTVKR